MPLIENDRYPRNDRTTVPVTSGDIRTIVNLAREQRINASHIQPVVRAQSADAVTSPIVLAETAAPGTPVADHASLYAKTDGKFYSKDDLGVEYEVSRRYAYAHARTGAAQTLATATLTIINFGTVTYDPLVSITTGAAWQYSMPVTGYYHVSVFLMFAATTNWDVGEAAELSLYRGGVRVVVLDRWDSGLTGVSQRLVLRGSADVECTVTGQTLDIRASQASGANLSLFNSTAYNHVSIHKI